MPITIQYNAAISACAKAGRADKALALLQHLQEHGPSHDVFPDATTYGAVISACEKAGQVDKALEVWQRLLDDGPARNVFPSTITYSAMISACEKAGMGQKALELFQHLVENGPAHGEYPDAIAYSATISACEKAGMVDEALDLLRHMLAVDPARGVFPDIVTYGTALAACEKAGRADGALEVLQLLQDHGPAHGVFPDTIAYSTAISACDKDDRLKEEDRLAAIDGLVDKAVVSRVFKPSLGFNAGRNKLDLHEPAVVTQPDTTVERDKGVHSAVAKAIFRRLLHQAVINDKTEFVVGHRGPGKLRETIEQCMRDQGWNPVHPVVFDRNGIGRENLGRLVVGQPSGLSSVTPRGLNPYATEFKPR